MWRVLYQHLSGLAVPLLLAAAGCSSSADRDAVNRGDEAYRRGDFDSAISCYTKAIQLDPKCAKAYCNRGAAFEIKGYHDRAIADSTEAIRLDSHYATAFYNRVAAYGKKGDYDKEIADYTECFGWTRVTLRHTAVVVWLTTTKATTTKRSPILQRRLP